MGFSCGDSSVKLLGIASLPKKLCQKEIPPSPKKETPLPEGGNCLTEVTLDNANCRLSTLIPAYPRPFPLIHAYSRLSTPIPAYPRLFPPIIAHSRISLPVLAYISLILPVPSLLLLPLHSLFIPSSFSLHSLFILSSFPLHSLFILSSFPLHSLFILSSFSLHSLFILSLFPLHSRLFPPIPAFPHPFPTYRFFPLVSSLRLMLVKRL